jgi:5-methylcytosine-specific restriction endonuclease McrA
MSLTHQSAWWKRRAAAWIRLNRLCLCCKSIGRVIVAVICDHVVPVSQGGAWDGPIQSACRRCHSTIKRHLEALFAAGRCTEADLRLDSKLAQELARKEYRRVGLDGWPAVDMLP